MLWLVRFALEMGCLGWAAGIRTPPRIHRFIVANFFFAAAGEAALSIAFWDNASRLYTGIYVFMSLWVYWTMAGIVKESLRMNPSRAVALIVAGTITAIVAGTLLGHVLGPFDWLTTLDASVLVFMGACVGMGAAKQTPVWQKTSLILMAYWFAQALFEMGLQLHLWNAAWMRTNEWLPAILTCGGCVWIAHISRLPGRRAEV